MVFNANTESKTEHTILMSIKNWAENWCQIVCGILFDLIYSVTSSVGGTEENSISLTGGIDVMILPSRTIIFNDGACETKTR